jgi:acyl-CoA reductase-like NAD-dependent aldehyde dehydrogenase
MGDVVKVMKIVTGPLHNAVLDRLDSTVLSEGEVFTTALMAAAAKYADLTSFDQLIAALKRLVADVENGRDPLALKTYWEVYGNIKSGKGRKIRSIICAAFLEYFRGNCKQLEWAENARIYE